MGDLVKHSENRRNFYLISLDRKMNDRTPYMDVTEVLKEANRRDKTLGYPFEGGPNFGIEVEKARTYAGYVSEHATPENLYKFNTIGRGGYLFFLNASTDDIGISKPHGRKRDVSDNAHQ